MKRQNHKVIVWLRVCVLAMFCPAFLWRCATVMNLEGGPIDTLPPVIVSMLPDNFTTNFTASKIYVTFDEFVQLKDQQKEFFTSPQMKKKPQLSIRGRGILIQIKDTLKENTTYALNFGSAVRDNNEGNPLYSMRYVFSTGPEVDSMVVSGYTADSYTADSVAKSFIYFFPADSVEDIPEYDSTMFKYQPAVIARAETNGIFIAQNLKPIPYRVYAFEDKNNNQIYEPSVDQVGFLTGTYNPAELPDFGIWYDSIRRYVTADPQLYFRMFTDEAFGRQYLRESERPVQHKALLYFNAGHPRIDSIVFDSIPADRVIIEPQSRNRDTIALWFDVPSASLPDTIRGEITYMKHDSLDRLLPSTEKLKLAWRYIESKEEAKEREQLEKEKAEVDRLYAQREEDARKAREFRTQMEKAKENARSRGEAEAKRLLAEAKSAADETFRELDALRKQQKKLDAQQMNAQRAEIMHNIKEARDAVGLRDERAEPIPKPSRPIREGDLVEIPGTRRQAEVTAVKGDTLTLKAGPLQMKVKADEVRLIEEAERAATAKKQPQFAPSQRILRTASAARELDIRGMETLEAESVLDNYIDAAVMAHLETVTIIHGKGTGALRKAVHASLKRNKAVKSFRLGNYGEGESGVTVVELK